MCFHLVSGWEANLNSATMFWLVSSLKCCENKAYCVSLSPDMHFVSWSRPFQVKHISCPWTHGLCSLKSSFLKSTVPIVSDISSFMRPVPDGPVAFLLHAVRDPDQLLWAFWHGFFQQDNWAALKWNVMEVQFSFSVFRSIILIVLRYLLMNADSFSRHKRQ